MDIKEILKETEVEFQNTVDFFEKDVATVRTGRANPSLVENILVDSYGSKLPIKQLASISVLDQRTLSIQPWDYSVISSVEKALSQSDLGANPIVDKNTIKITLPSLTEEYRKKLLKLLNDKAESAKISQRKSREDTWKKMQDGFRAGEIREDDKFKGKEDLQKLIDEYGKKIDAVIGRKEKEIMEN